MPSDDLIEWLGPAANVLTPEQLDQVIEVSRRIDAYYPHPDEAPDREAALSAVVQHLLGEITPDEARRTLIDAVQAEHRARVAAIWLGVMLVAEGAPKKQTAQDVGINRMTLLEALGERPRRRKTHSEPQ